MSKIKIQREICIKKLHELTEDNIYIVPKTGQRYCKACMRDRRKVKPAPSPLDQAFHTLLLPKEVWHPFNIHCILWERDPEAFLIKLIQKYLEEHK